MDILLKKGNIELKGYLNLNITLDKKYIITPTKVSVPSLENNNIVLKKGYYLQVAVFTRRPSQKFLNNAIRKGYKCIVQPVKIKETIYNKILIGPYGTKEEAVIHIKKARIDFNNKSAYILRF